MTDPKKPKKEDEPFVGSDERPDIAVDLDSKLGDISLRDLQKILGGAQQGDLAAVPWIVAAVKVAKDGKDGKDSKDGKDNKDNKDPKDSKDGKDTKDSKDNKDNKDSTDTSHGFLDPLIQTAVPSLLAELLRGRTPKGPKSDDS